MRWFKVIYKAPRGERTGWFFKADADDVLAAVCDYPYPYEIHEATTDEITDLDPVVRGLKEATTDELYDELQERGWKVQMSK